MLPTFHNKEFLLVDKLSYLLQKPSRGDVVIFKLYEESGSSYAGRYLIKRIIGLPGERVVVKGGVTTIYNEENKNGFVVAEPFVTHQDVAKNSEVILKSGQYFVMGDNRLESYDSRTWGPLEDKQLRGRVLMRVLPLSTFGVHPGAHPYDK